MRRLQPILVPGNIGVAARVEDLRAAGVRQWRLYKDDLDAPFHGVRLAPGLDGSSFEGLAAATALVLKPGQFISRRSAAALMSIPVVRRRTLSVVQVGAVRPRRPPERAGIVGHQIEPHALRVVPRGPRWLPAPDDAWALLGGVSSVDDLIVAGDHLVSKTRRGVGPGCSFEHLVDAVSRFEGCRGVAKLRAALPLIRPGVASPSETLVRLLVTRAGFDEPVTNCPVQTLERELHADLGYPQWKIAIEYDGAYHFEGGAAQAKFDNERCERMRDAGWHVLLLTSLDLRDPREFLARLARAIDRARR